MVCVGALDVEVRLPRRRSEGVAKRQKIRLGAIAVVSLCRPPRPACKCPYGGCEAHADVEMLCGLGTYLPSDLEKAPGFVHRAPD